MSNLPPPNEFSAEVVKDNPILQFFHYEHLPSPLKEISFVFCNAARSVLERCAASAERTNTFRKLLEAKDSAVRALSVS